MLPYDQNHGALKEKYIPVYVYRNPVSIAHASA